MVTMLVPGLCFCHLVDCCHCSILFTAMLKTTSVTGVDNDYLSHEGSKPIDLTCNISWFKLQMQTSPKTRYMYAHAFMNLVC